MTFRFLKAFSFRLGSQLALFAVSSRSSSPHEYPQPH